MTGKQIAAGAAALLIAAGAYGYYKSTQEPTGPGSGEEVEVGEQTGPGSGEELGPGETNEPTGPGSGEELGPGETNEPTGPGSGEELPDVNPNEPTGPGSGEELGMMDEPTGPGSGEELGPGETNEPTGPGSGEELPDVQPSEPTGPGSGEELPDVEPASAEEPGGPGSGEEREDPYLDNAIASCNVIAQGSTCVEYVGDYWNEETAGLNCGRPEAFSMTPCPRPYLGGCVLNFNTDQEMVTWHYTEGGGGYTPEVVPYASQACELSGGNWFSW